MVFVLNTRLNKWKGLPEEVVEPDRITFKRYLSRYVKWLVELNSNRCEVLHFGESNQLWTFTMNGQSLGNVMKYLGQHGQVGQNSLFLCCITDYLIIPDICQHLVN